MPGCTECTDTDMCNVCDSGLYMKRDYSGCMQRIDNCLTDPSGYSMIPDTPYCKTCRDGFYPEGMECVPCSKISLSTFVNTTECQACMSLGINTDCEEECTNIEINTDCEACTVGGICTACSGNKFPAGEGKTCQGKIDNCDSKMVNYKMDHKGNWYCPQCASG